MNARRQETAPDADLDAAVAPFAALHKRETALGRYMRLFSGREDCFARQWADRETGKQGYVPMRRALGQNDLEAHLRGRSTYGIYLLRRDARVRTAVIDVDLVKTFRNRKLTTDERKQVGQEKRFLFSRITDLSRARGLAPLAEFSGGKGWHFWYFFAEPVHAGAAKELLTGIRDGIAGDLAAFSLEVFPKQEEFSGKGLGNLVKLPLGVHQMTGRRSCFPDCKDRSAEAQLAFLKTVTPAPAEAVRQEAEAGEGDDEPPPAAPVVPLPGREKGAAFPGLTRLANACPPLGRAVLLCRSGHGLSLREEKVLFQTIGFMPEAKAVLHHLMAQQPEYNPHLVDYRLSRVRGTPLGCRRIHTLMEYTGDFCRFRSADGYHHPLHHLGLADPPPKAEKVENLTAALDNLKQAIAQVERFLV